MSKPKRCIKCGHRCHKRKTCFKCANEASMRERTASAIVCICATCECEDCQNIRVFRPVHGPTHNVKIGQYK